MISLNLVFNTRINGKSDLIIVGKTVEEKTKAPISNVNIFVPELEIGTLTDSNGIFSIPVEKFGSYTINFSHIGYEFEQIVVEVPIEEHVIVQMEETFFEMDEIVVTSTRTSKLFRDVPVITEVITKTEIDDSGTLNVAELLAQRSGISFLTSVEGAAMFNLLGMDSRYILVLIDGQPVTGKFNSRVSLDQIPTNSVERIEIIKGPSSSLYGSEAMGGVINIFTSNSKEKSKSFSLNVRYSARDKKFNILNKNSGKRNIQGTADYFLGNLFNKFNFNINLINTDKTVLSIDVDEIERVSIRNLVRWNMNPFHTLSLGLNGYRQNNEGSTSLMVNETEILRGGINLTHMWNIKSNVNLDHKIWVENYKRKYIQYGPSGILVTGDVTQENSLEYEMNLIKTIEENTLNFGLEFNRSHYKSDRVSKGSQMMNQGSVFGQFDWNISPELNLIVGTRLDNYPDINPVFSPRIGIMKKLSNRWKMRTTFGKGFRAPTFMEKFIDWTHAQYQYTVIGNPELKPETSLGYTAGFEYYHTSQYQASLMIYRTYFHNMIYDYTITPNVLSYQNIDHVIYTGVEVSVRWSISTQLLSSWSINLVDNRDMEDVLIPNTQPLSAHIRLSYLNPKGKLKGTIQNKIIGAYYPQEFNPESGDFNSGNERHNTHQIIDINFSYKILENLIIGGGSHNFNNYTNAQYGPFIGRTYYIQLTTQEKGT